MADRVLKLEILERLRQATAGNSTVLEELCRDYLAEARATIAQLRDAVTQGNAIAVRERAHYLKGSSMMIGAEGLSQCCATLELMGRNSNLDAAEPALEQTMAALKEVETALAERLGPMVLPEEGTAA